MTPEPASDPLHAALRRTVLFVALLNLAYFGVEFCVALAIGSVSLFADSIDFLEDAAVNLIVLLALGLSARSRAVIGMGLAALLLVPAAAALLTAWRKLSLPLPPEPAPLTLAGAGALAVNVFCAFLLARHRTETGSLTKAAFLSARNDAIANIAIIAAGFVTAFWWRSAWPDLAVGIGIAIMNAGAAHAVWRAAREEHRRAA